MQKPYTDESPMRWGKYKRKALNKVPAEYLLELYEDRTHADHELIDYLTQNLPKIQERIEKKTIKPKSITKSHLPPISDGIIGQRFNGKRMVMTCNPTQKVIYITKKDANAEIRRIQKYEDDRKKPQRSYECDKCGGWHLTSISKQDWENKK